MRRLERLLMLVAVALACAPLQADEEPLHRHRAGIVVEQPGAFVRLPLTPEVYAKSRQADLADLRVIDSSGERVPFALLAPRADDLQIRERWRDVRLYRLPPRQRAADPIGSPVELVVGSGQVLVRTQGAPKPGTRTPGWLIDLGERGKDDPRPSLIKLQWSSPTEFTSPYRIEHSADLRQWRAATGGQLLALASPGGALTQPDVPLPADVDRFVRIVWAGAEPHPELSGARAALVSTQATVLDPPTEIVLAATPAPAKGTADEPRGALLFDLGAALPILRLDLQLPAGNRVLPVQVQLRDREDAAWRNAAGAVFYRLEQGSDILRPPPLALNLKARFIRLVPDERAAAPKPDEVRLMIQVRLPSVVFASQGSGGYQLLAGAQTSSTGALPLPTLIADLERERPRFGRARLDRWTEVDAAVAQQQAQARRAAWRPWLLWAVLLAGVLGLALMVWAMARRPKVTASVESSTPPPPAAAS